METSTYPTITDEEGKVFHIVPELLSFMDKESVAAHGKYDPRGYPAGCSACHFNRKERRQPQHPSRESRDPHEHCNSPVNGLVHKYECAEHTVIFVSPRNLKRYQLRAAVARLTGELK